MMFVMSRRVPAATAGLPQLAAQAAFLTVDDLDSKPWIAGHRDAAFDGLAAAYGAAWALEHGGISFAVGPLRTRREAVVLRLAARYSQALFPFVEGTPGTCDPLGTAGRDALIRQLAELHRTLPPPGLGLSRRPYAIPERAALMAALDQLGSRWEAGPLAEPARQALAARAADVTSWLGELEALAGLLRQDDADLVVTHGEPHPGNLIHTDAGARADRLGHRRARPSRARPVDARRRHPGMPSPAPGTGRAHDLRQAMEFCRLAWTLSDIASFVQMFRSPHRETRWLGTSSPGFSISSRESHQRLTAARNGDSGNAHRQFSPPARRQADLHELDSRSAL